MLLQISRDARLSTELLYNVTRIYLLLLACPLAVPIVAYKSCEQQIRITVIYWEFNGVDAASILYRFLCCFKLVYHHDFLLKFYFLEYY